MSKVLGADVGEISLVMAEMPYRSKRETLLALIKAKPLPQDQRERIAWFLGELNKWNALRNSIAHSGWKTGTRPKSVKPLSVSARGGAASYKGLEPEERDYTDRELVDIAHELIGNHERFRDYLFSVNLLDRSIGNDV